MNTTDKKYVLVIDEELPLGLIANTAAILGITLGKLDPTLVGPDVTDGSGLSHAGITAYPIPILKGNKELLSQLRQKLYSPEYSQLTAIDFSDTAQSCLDYDHFTQRMAETSEEDLTYLGMGIFGSKKLINRLTGSMPLLR